MKKPIQEFTAIAGQGDEGIFLPNYSAAEKQQRDYKFGDNALYIKYSTNQIGINQGVDAMPVYKLAITGAVSQSGECSWRANNTFNISTSVYAINFAPNDVQALALTTEGNAIFSNTVTINGDNSTVDTAYVPMVLYNTDATPPTASGFPIGTLYVQYTA